jgi:hypothetical protein
VQPLDPVVEALSPGSTIPARTMGWVEDAGSRLVIHVPLPYKFSGDAPSSFYSPVPARTAGPLLSPPPRRRRESPRPSPSPSPSVIPSAVEGQPQP